MRFDFDEITEDLYVGSRFEPGDWHILAALNITVDVNLQAEAQDRFTEAAPEVYLWLPTPDWFGPGVQALATGARFIALMIREGRKVYVHCNAGAGRAPTVATGYLITTGMSLEEALKLVRTRRPAFSPNPTQMRQLREFAATWRDDGQPSSGK
jgi:protein-tyrosine phosphatase